jgi:Amt family ammonium transporter
LAAFVTVIGASVGGLFWTLLDFLVTKRWSMEKFCAGAVAGLVIVTPASGYVAPWAALIMTLLGIMAVRSCIGMKHHLGFDDTLDAFGIHGVGGVVGKILTGVFADARIGAYDGSAINGGWISQNFIQLGYQVAGTVATAAYSFIISAVLLLIIDRIPGLNLRATDFEEVSGLDHFQLGDEAYLMSGGTSGKKSVVSEAVGEPGLMIVTNIPSSHDTIGN